LLNAWKWRIVLPVAIVLLSIGLSPLLFNGLLAHSFNLFFVVMTLTLVPRAIQGVTYQYQLPHLYWTHGYWFRFMFWEQLLMVFLFWCWVGWKIDLKAAGRDCSNTWTIVEIILGLACSLVTFQIRAGERLPPYRNAGPWLAIMWSAILLSYSLLRVSQLLATPRRPSR
jgi:hypothetical protein